MRSAFAVAALLSLLVAEQASARSIPAPLAVFELATRPIGADDAPWTITMRVRSDGLWTADGREGHLERKDVVAIRRAAWRARHDSADDQGAHCMAEPDRFMRLTTSFSVTRWEVPCGSGVGPRTSALVELVTRLIQTSRAKSDAVLVHFEHTSMDHSRAGVDVSVRADGRFEASRGGIFDDGQRTSGQLTSSQMTDLLSRLHHATFGRADRFEPCAARLEGSARLDAPGLGTFSWSTPCGQPHPSLTSVVQFLSNLVRR